MNHCAAQVSRLCCTTETVEDIRLNAATMCGSQALFQTIFEQTNVAMAITDLEGRPIAGNAAFQQLLGYSLDELCRSQIPFLAHRDDVKAVQALYKEVANQWRSSGRLDARYVRRGGELIWTELCLSPIREGPGLITGVIAVLLDLTERKNAEETCRRNHERLQRAMESIPDEIVVYDRDLRVRYMNDAARRIAGGPASDFVGKFDEEIWPEEVYQSYLTTLRAALENQERRSVEVNLTKAQTGYLRSQQITCVPVLGKGGEVQEILRITRDVTESRLAAETKGASDTKYRRLYETMIDGFANVGLDGRILEFNEPYRAKLGYESEELRALTYVDLTPEKWHAIEAEIVETQVLTRGYSDIYEKEYRRKDGTIIPVELRTILLRDPDGTPVSMWGLFRDITERKQAEMAIRKSAETYKALLRTTQDGVAVLDPEGRLLEANDAYCQLVGYRRDELLRMHIPDIEADESPEQIKEHLAKLRAGGTGQFERRLRRRDGVLVDVEVRLTWLPSENVFIVFHHDISERKRDEEARALLAAAIEQAAEAMFITDAAGTIQYVNPAFENITGYSRAEALGQNPRILKSGQQGEEFYRELWDTISSGKAWTGRLINRRKNGTFYEEEATISPVTDGSGKIINFVAGKRDVTRERTLEEQLRQAQKIEAIGQLAAGIAHDFNNLLTALVGYLDVARAALPSEHAAGEALAGIGKVAEQAAGITKALRTFSVRSVAAREPLCLGTIVGETVKLLRHMLHKSIRLDIDAPTEGSPWVCADRTQLQQVFINLAINARDAMPDGGTLSIAVCPVGATQSGAVEGGPQRPEVQVVVRDTGVGMTPEIQARIFDPFFTTKSRARGTGLGLAIVHGIVQDHAGRVEVQSEPGKGSTFRVVLPCVPPASRATESQATIASTARGRGELILLAEDDVEVRGLLITELERLGYTVVSAEDGDEVLRRYEERRGALRLLVLDFDLPRRTGGECLRLVRQGGDNVPVLLISGALSFESLAEQLDAVLLHKPFGLAKFAEQVHRMLQTGATTAQPA